MEVEAEHAASQHQQQRDISSTSTVTTSTTPTIAAVASSGVGGMFDEQGPRKSSDSDHSTSSYDTSYKRRMGGLKALRNQIVNAMSSNVDPNTRITKLKRDMVDLGNIIYITHLKIACFSCIYNLLAWYHMHI